MKRLAATAFFALTLSAPLRAGDWPMWRADARRSATSSNSMPAEPALIWRRVEAPLVPAYASPRIQFDLGYEPVVSGKTIVYGSSRNDRITALDTETGRERWRFYADGPIRFAPVAIDGRVYVGSDDGHVYCLDLADGSVRWRFRAVPSTRKILGNRRLISVWPVRGGPVVSDGTLYFAAGVWSFEGAFVWALDAASGDVRWLNDSSGFVYGQQPHGAEGFGGLTPQGYLVLSGDSLFVPCGTAYPASFDARTGKLLDFALPRQSRYPGGWFAFADEERSRALRRGKLTFDRDVNAQRHEDNMRHGDGVSGARSSITLAGRSVSFADGLPLVEGTIHSLLAADDKLFVVTREGVIACFAEKSAAGDARKLKAKPTPLESADDGWTERTASVVKLAGARDGYALVFGLGTGGLLRELLLQTNFQIVGVDLDADKVARLRRRLDDAGLYGTRATLWAGAASDFEFPPYLASLIASESGFPVDPDDEEALGAAYRSLRPFGGAMLFAAEGDDHRRALLERLELAALPGAKVEDVGAGTVLRRVGPLPGASDYTGGWHSPDDLVRAPFGVLWYDDTQRFFKRSPQPYFVRGVMVGRTKDWASGASSPYPLLARSHSDVYTGRALSPREVEAAKAFLPPAGVATGQPNQYRPPTQKNAWNPKPPRFGHRINPLTGEREVRAIPKSYGCDGGVDYGHIFSMRSGTAAVYDMRLESGTINISGPRSGCTNTIIPASGVLNVPYYYEGCTCSYPLPVGLALVNMPETHEQWASWGKQELGSVQRVGVNFGAPGDRMTASGTLWLDVPSAGGPSPSLAVTTIPDKPGLFYRHALWVRGGRGWPWVAASGLLGVERVTIGGLTPDDYLVRLTFLDPGNGFGRDSRPRDAGVFHVDVQGSRLASEFDPETAAGGAMRAHVLARRAVAIGPDGELRIDLVPIRGRTVISGIELVRAGLDAGAIQKLEEKSE